MSRCAPGFIRHNLPLAQKFHRANVSGGVLDSTNLFSNRWGTAPPRSRLLKQSIILMRVERGIPWHRHSQAIAGISRASLMR
jgi:hypothetical protein